jgi:hypothetical protein
MVNFALFFIQTTAYAKDKVPQIVEYRGCSGHWMAFYFVGAAALYSASRLRLSQRRCPVSAIGAAIGLTAGVLLMFRNRRGTTMPTGTAKHSCVNRRATNP